ncbi:MAG: ATP synthase F0 subunit C [bacterium]|nr:ATP synthase F0 subunit C [bacterium]
MEFEPQTWNMLGRFLGSGVALGLGGIGAAVGMGMAAGQADEGIMRQPDRQGDLLRTMLIGQAAGGAPSILALVVGILILFLGPRIEVEEIGGSFFAAMLGAGLAMGFGCFGSGLGCGWPAGAACDCVARNPRHSTMISSRMILGQAVAQSPAIFATVIGIILVFVKQVPGTDWGVMGVLIGSGIAIGAGALGPGLGSGYTAGGAVNGIGRWPRNQALTLRTMLVGQGVCETPAIFAVLVAFMMLFGSRVDATFVGFAKALGAGIAVGFGGIGPGIGSGLAGGSACESTARRPRLEPLILRTMLIGQAVSQSTAIYALIIAFIILFAN